MFQQRYTNVSSTAASTRLNSPEESDSDDNEEWNNFVETRIKRDLAELRKKWNDKNPFSERYPHFSTLVYTAVLIVGQYAFSYGDDPNEGAIYFLTTVVAATSVAFLCESICAAIYNENDLYEHIKKNYRPRPI